MKFAILILSFLAFASHAQTSPADEELLKAYQREYAFLAAQKASLQEQAERVRRSQREKAKTAENSVKQLEADLVRAQTGNDKLFEDVQIFERRRKDEQGRELALKSLWKRTSKAIAENRDALQFRSEAVAEQLPPENLTVGELSLVGSEAVKVLRESNGSATFERSFVNENDELVEGKILRDGRIAAFSLSGGSPALLGPGGDSGLKTITDIPKADFNASVIPVYAFESIREKIKLKRPAGWMESVADISPILFLGILFLLVGWLFTKLARI